MMMIIMAMMVMVMMMMMIDDGADPYHVFPAPPLAATLTITTLP